MASDIPDGHPVHVVAKVFPAQITLGRARKPDDLVVESNKTLVLTTGGSEVRHTLDHVFDTSATEAEIYQKTLIPGLNAFMEGVTGCIMIFGATRAQRQEMFQGSDSSPGLTAKIIDSMFVGLQRKHKRLSDETKGGIDFKASFTFCEVYDEVIQDLLNSQNRDLAIVEDIIEGSKVDGLTTSGPHNSSRSMTAAFRAGVAARSSVSSDFGPASQYASCVFTINLVQEVKMSHKSKSTFLTSKLLVANIAGAEKVAAADPAALRSAEGPRLNKGVFAFQRICDVMSAGKHAEFIPYADSKLTLLLKEAFGGNCFTRAIFCLAQTDPTSAVALKMASQLRQGVVYPIIVDSVAQGLLRRLRIELRSLREQIAKLQTGRVSDEHRTVGEEADLMLRISELEGNSIKHNLEKLKLTEDRDNLYEKFKQFRDKYNQLVRGKAEVQAALIHSEEEKLKVSKALLDLQIENTQLKEAVDKEKFDLGARLLTAENDIVEMEMKYQSEFEKVSQLKAQIEEMVVEKKEIAIELVSLRTNLMQRTSDLKAERAKTDDLSEHILTLANTKEVLEKKIAMMSRSYEGNEAERRNQDESAARMHQEMEMLQDKVRELTEKLDIANSDRIKAELQAQKAEVEFSKKKVTIEKSMADYTKNVDTELQRERERSIQEVEQLSAYREVTERKIKSLEASVKPLQRQVADLKAQLMERERLEEEQAGLVTTLEKKIVEVREEARSKLLATLAQVQSRKGAKGARENIINELVTTYHQAEEEAVQQVNVLRTDNHKLVKNNRRLSQAVRSLHTHLSDVNPEEVQKLGLQDIDQLTVAEEPSALEAKLTTELKAATRSAEEAKQQLHKEKEAHVRSAEQFQAQLMEANQKLADTQASLQLAEKELARAKESGGGFNEEAITKLKDMMEQQQKQIMEQQAARPAPRAPSPPPPVEAPEPAGAGSGAGMGGGADPEEVAELKGANKELKSANKELKAKNKELQSQNKSLAKKLKSAESKLKAAQKALAEAEKAAAAAPAPAAAAAPAPAPAEAADEATLLGQLQAEQTRSAQLLTRNTVLEEELDNYKKYMKTQIKKYQKEIAKLKKKK